MKQNKYNYLAVIQQHYGQGWEDVSEYETYSTGECKEKTEITVISKKTGLPVKRFTSLCRADFGEYQRTGYATRIIFRKELNNSLTNETQL